MFIFVDDGGRGVKKLVIFCGRHKLMTPKQDYLEVEKIHYKALKIVYNSNECYEELLIRNNEVSIHQRQLCTLATEIYKSLI